MTEMVEVTRTFLQLESPAQLRATAIDDPALHVERVIDCPVSFYQYLYREVGRRYQWRDRLDWTDDQTRAHLARSDTSVWVLSRGGAPAGWFELVLHDDRSVEIAYFGLLPDFIGQGLGKRMLSVAATTAWGLGAERVWLHTCTLDNPSALPNYLARGFTAYKTEKYTVTR
ncbi:MAG: GNAT family N-acetyltransferase [Gemmatimonadota bacterium]|nr:GNAT family N-acetyltransferase [Gemmatimonadota bacterium]